MSNFCPDIDQLWMNMLDFKFRGMLTLKNRDNNLPTESWDSMYHTGIFLMIASLRLKRSDDLKVATEIEETLDTILENEVFFRGFNSDGEYWDGHMEWKYRPLWGDKEVFGDTSRDQILKMLVGLVFLKYVLKDGFALKYPSLETKLIKIAHLTSARLIQDKYDIGTTWGNCQTFSIPFSLALNYIDPAIPLLSKKSKIYRKSARNFYYIPYGLAFINLHGNYFTNELFIDTLGLILMCFNSNYPNKLLKRCRASFKFLIKRHLKDTNLYFELFYRMTSGEILKQRNFEEQLNTIFELMPNPKIQDFIWQRHPEDRYKPHEINGQNKNFYAPWHDYLVIYELIKDFKK